jgi:translation initiation factor 2 subunit 3
MENINKSSENINETPLYTLVTLGSVGDGKSSLIRELTGIKTQKHSSEKKRNITIKAGFANLKIWECVDCDLLSSSSSEDNNLICSCCEKELKLVNHLSFADLPGHQELILTMMSSVSLVRGGICIVSAFEPISRKPQLIQHLIAAKMANIDNLIVCLNKLDLVSKEVAKTRKKELDDLLEKLEIKPSIIIPTCFNKKLGISNLLKSIMNIYPPVTQKENINPILRTTRSFDINKVNTEWTNIKGGVIGGTLTQGELKIGDEIEIRPGIISKDKSQPIITKILSLQTDGKDIDKINSSGLVAIGTDIDPYYCKGDLLIGSVVGKVGTLPPVYNELTIKYNKLELDGIDIKWEPILNDVVFLQILNTNVEAKIIKNEDNKLTFKLIKPVCIEANSKILVCKKIDSILKITGYGTF